MFSTLRRLLFWAALNPTVDSLSVEVKGPDQHAVTQHAPARGEGTALFVATLRPTSSAMDSTAYGTATLLVAPNGESAHLRVSFSNLTSARVSSHLKLGAPGDEGRYLKSFYGEQPPFEFDWDFAASADVTKDQLKHALADGLLFIAIDTKRHPAGELRGQLIRAAGSSSFTPPAPPPAWSARPVTERDAARFLTQATFGPTRADLERVVAEGFDAWLSEQMAVPHASHREATLADYAAYPPLKGKPRIRPDNRQAAWWKLSVTAPDQLRQRVAFALSEIFVVSDTNGALGKQTEALAAYYDLLATDAFGNFRQLLEHVTLSPVMGAYLSHLKNAKGDPQRGTSPDENFAREVMQLFTIGLNRLQPDGTYQLDAAGQPIPTYDQSTVVETAKVFTGWGFQTARPRRDFRARPNFFQPMMQYPAQHDDTPKLIVNNIRIPAIQGGARDLQVTLDTLFNHPNTAPFFCRQLIQRLVTSNPSPAYVYRVAQVFEHNARGERGDLGAVVRAVLLDYEARSSNVIANVGYGKLKEPLLQVTALLRAFGGSAKNGRYHLPRADDALGQTALHSPTVFNFFEPDYVLPGPLAAAGLHAPEYQILTATTAITIANQLRALIFTPPDARDEMLTLNLEPLAARMATPRDALNELDLIFCGGGMSTASRQRIEQGLRSLPRRATALDQARFALELTVTSPDASVQR
ncbi:MAG: DUF1800 family protein [Opitutus sp.]